VPLPSTRLLGLLAAAAPLYLFSTGAGVTAALVLATLALFDWRRTGGGAEPTATRRAPLRLPQGATATIDIAVVNPSAHRLHVRVTDDTPPQLERGGDDVFELDLAPNTVGHVRYTVRAAGRGICTLGDVHLRVLGPWQLAWREVRVRRADPIRIQPGVLEMKRFRLLGLRQRMRRMGLRNVRQRGEGRSFESLREYARGDDPRTIDWKVTARRGGLTVRQHEAERSQNVLIAIDAGRLMIESLGARDRLDHALSSALLLADVAGTHGDRVGLFVFADRVQQFLPPRRIATARLADALAAVQPRPVESNYPAAFNFLARQLGRRSLIVAFTDVIDTGASEALVAQLARAAQRHVMLAVALRNPGILERAAAPAHARIDGYRRAAAEDLLQARALALATMRRAGVLVADAEPDELVTEVVNRYLEVKYRGMI
jgi:uncharacterized protein (DUF58 family)